MSTSQPIRPTQTEFADHTTASSGVHGVSGGGGVEDTANKDQANGYAGLDANSHIVRPIINRPDTDTKLKGVAWR